MSEISNGIMMNTYSRDTLVYEGIVSDYLKRAEKKKINVSNWFYTIYPAKNDNFIPKQDYIILQNLIKDITGPCWTIHYQAGSARNVTLRFKVGVINISWEETPDSKSSHFIIKASRTEK